MSRLRCFNYLPEVISLLLGVAPLLTPNDVLPASDMPEIGFVIYAAVAALIGACIYRMYKKPGMWQHLPIFALPLLWVMVWAILADIFSITNGLAFWFSIIMFPFLVMVFVAVYIAPAVVVCIVYTVLYERRFSQAKKEDSANEQ